MKLGSEELREIALETLLDEFQAPLDQFEGSARERLSEKLAGDLPRLAERITIAALEGDELLLESLQGVPGLWFEEARIAVDALQVEALRATVRATFGVLRRVAAQSLRDAT